MSAFPANPKSQPGAAQQSEAESGAERWHHLKPANATMKSVLTITSPL
jgi:hypothetical protein